MSLPSASTTVTMLPKTGTAVVKSVSSGDTVTLLGRPTSNGAPPPEVLFTLERISAPRIGNLKANNNVDEPGAFPAREWLRELLVGKTVQFESRKQQNGRVYGLLRFPNPDGSSEPLNLGVEAVRKGLVVPKLFSTGAGEDGEVEDEYVTQLETALAMAKNEGVGLHDTANPPLIRRIQTAGEDFNASDLVHHVMNQKTKVTVVLEYVFDGSRIRCQVVDDSTQYQYGFFTLILAGVNCPRTGNPRADPPTKSEPFAEAARTFVEQRLLQRQLQVSLHGTDKSGACIVGTVHHPKGSIAVELLKRGYGKVTDWTARMMDPLDLPALRVAENGAKRTNLGVWETYKPPTLSTASSVQGQVVEVISGDTLSILPSGKNYDNESKLMKLSLASIRSPRVGNERMGKPDEPFAAECKERLRALCIGKTAKIAIHYERDIPLATGPESRSFATVSVGKHDDVGETLVKEGLATVQFHKDGEEKSTNYDNLMLAESTAKAAKLNVHSNLKDYKPPKTNDLVDPKKAKAYSGALIRAGNLKGIVEYVFNGSRFKIFIPSENCHVAFACDYIRCPQAGPPPGSVNNKKPAEPFGDEAKRYAKLLIHQRHVEINVRGCTTGGVMTGQLFAAQPRVDFTLEIVGAGLATLDERKLEYNEVPRQLMEAQAAAQNNRVGIWSAPPKAGAAMLPAAATKAKVKEQSMQVRISEIRNASHIFVHKAGDDAIGVIEESMKVFTQTHGNKAAPCDAKPGKIVAGWFDGGWYRAKVLSRVDRGSVSVLFIDHGNVATLTTSRQVRPLDPELNVTRIPAVAREAILALLKTRPVTDDDGMEAARMLQSLAWGKPLTAIQHAVVDGKAVLTLNVDGETTSINEQMVSAGCARVVKPNELTMIQSFMVDGNALAERHAALTVAQDLARKHRSGMWRYGDVGDSDDEEVY